MTKGYKQLIDTLKQNGSLKILDDKKLNSYALMQFGIKVLAKGLAKMMIEEDRCNSEVNVYLERLTERIGRAYDQQLEIEMKKELKS